MYVHNGAKLTECDRFFIPIVVGQRDHIGGIWEVGRNREGNILPAVL